MLPILQASMAFLAVGPSILAFDQERCEDAPVIKQQPEAQEMSCYLQHTRVAGRFYHGSTIGRDDEDDDEDLGVFGGAITPDGSTSIRVKAQASSGKEPLSLLSEKLAQAPAPFAEVRGPAGPPGAPGPPGPPGPPGSGAGVSSATTGTTTTTTTTTTTSTTTTTTTTTTSTTTTTADHILVSERRNVKGWGFSSEIHMHDNGSSTMTTSKTTSMTTIMSTTRTPTQKRITTTTTTKSSKTNSSSASSTMRTSAATTTTTGNEPSTTSSKSETLEGMREGANDEAPLVTTSVRISGSADVSLIKRQPCFVVLNTRTGKQREASTAGLVTAAFFVKGGWTEELEFFNGSPQDALRTEFFELASNPSHVKLRLHSKDNWGFKELGVYTSDGRHCELVESNPIVQDGHSMWLGAEGGDVGSEREISLAPCGQVCRHTPNNPELVKPETPPCTVILAAKASNLDGAGTTGLVTASFEVGGSWSRLQRFFMGIERGKTRTMQYDLPGTPTKVRLVIHSEDSFGFQKIRISSSDGLSSCLLANSKGAEYSENSPWWMDVDGKTNLHREFDMSACKPLCKV